MDLCLATQSLYFIVKFVNHLIKLSLLRCELALNLVKHGWVFCFSVLFLLENEELDVLDTFLDRCIKLSTYLINVRPVFLLSHNVGLDDVINQLLALRF